MDSSATMTAGGGGTEAFRLPRTVEPEGHHVRIEPKFASATFSGTLAIDAVVHEPIDVVVMNAAELAVSDVEVRTADGSALACAVHFDDDLEQVSFRPSAPLPPGRLRHHVPFLGDPQRQAPRILPFDLYRSRRREPDDGDDPIRVGGRPAGLPLFFDEPDRKAVFDVTLTVDAGEEAISNSPVVATESGGEKRRVRFSPTMKMSPTWWLS